MASELTFDNNVTRIISRVAFGLAFISVALRFYTRLRIKVQIGWDDWWILIGLLLTSLSYALLQWGALTEVSCIILFHWQRSGANGDRDVGDLINEAFDNHTTDTFDTKPHETFLKLYFVCSILYFSMVTAIKMSILLMYRRIFSVDPLFRLQSLLLGGFIVAFWLATTITRIFFCRPIGYIWMGLDLEKHCLSYNPFWIAVGAIDIFVDIILLTLPMRAVLKIQLYTKQKVSLAILFLLGGLQVLPFSFFALFPFQSTIF